MNRNAAAYWIPAFAGYDGCRWSNQRAPNLLLVKSLADQAADDGDIDFGGEGHALGSSTFVIGLEANPSTSVIIRESG